MKKNRQFFRKLGAVTLASSLMVSRFPQMQLANAATTFSLTSKVTIGKGETFQLNAKSSHKISFRSSNKKIVSVTKSGKIKGKKVGTATIIATANKKVKRCKVTVKAAPKKISFSQEMLTLLPGQKQKLTVSLSSGYSKKITYKTANSQVAKVSANGVVTAITAGETTITAKTFNGKIATICCIVADCNTAAPTQTPGSMTQPVFSPVVTGEAITTLEPVTTENAATKTPAETTNTPDTSMTPVTANPSTNPGETPTPTNNASITSRPLVTVPPTSVPVTPAVATTQPSMTPATTATAAVEPTVTPATTATAPVVPSLLPCTTPITPVETTVTSSAVISKIENGTIYVNDNSMILGLTSCITYYKTCFDGTLYKITKDELLPGDTIEITSSGQVQTTFPSLLMECDMIVVKETVANAIIEDKIANILNAQTLELVNHKNTKFKFDPDTKIYKNGQEITLEQLKQNDVIRVCAYAPNIKGQVVSMDSYVGFARTIVVLGDSVEGLQSEIAYFFYQNTSFTFPVETLWYTSEGAYLVTKDTLLEIEQTDGTIRYEYLKEKQVPNSSELTIYYEILPEEEALKFQTTKKIVRVSYKEKDPFSYPPVAPKKPVIYLYPEEKTDVTVDLDFDGTLTYTYPYTQDGHWEVTADTDGTLINKADGLEYSYIFWEGATDKFIADFSKGFCVKGEDTTKFLQTILPQMGLTPKEYNEFIVYWAPLMQENPYNLISFQTDNYEANAPLTINPAPDCMLRVYMAYKPLTSPVDIEPQTFEPFVRKGFTVVEWGGCVINK